MKIYCDWPWKVGLEREVVVYRKFLIDVWMNIFYILSNQLQYYLISFSNPMKIHCYFYSTLYPHSDYGPMLIQNKKNITSRQKPPKIDHAQCYLKPCVIIPWSKHLSKNINKSEAMAHNKLTAELLIL